MSLDTRHFDAVILSSIRSRGRQNLSGRPSPHPTSARTGLMTRHRLKIPEKNLEVRHVWIELATKCYSQTPRLRITSYPLLHAQLMSMNGGLRTLVVQQTRLGRHWAAGTVPTNPFIPRSSTQRHLLLIPGGFGWYPRGCQPLIRSTEVAIFVLFHWPLTMNAAPSGSLYVRLPAEVPTRTRFPLSHVQLLVFLCGF